MPRMLTSDDAQLNYRIDDFRDPWDTEPRDAILMHHGNVKNMSFWTAWVPVLSRKYPVVRLDVRGFGMSSLPPREFDWNAARYGQDALELMDHLGLEKVHWIGGEAGAIVGMELAISHPDRIRSLTLVGAPSDFWIVDQNAPPEHVASQGIINWGFQDWMAKTNVRRMQSVTEPKMIEWYHSVEATMSREAVTAFQLSMNDLRLAAAKDPDRRKLLSEIKAPTLLLLGDRNVIMPVDDQYKMHRLLSASRMVVFPNIAHNIALLIPDRCTEEVMRFLGAL